MAAQMTRIQIGRAGVAPSRAMPARQFSPVGSGTSLRQLATALLG
jgi:hypothetical protein